MSSQDAWVPPTNPSSSSPSQSRDFASGGPSGSGPGGSLYQPPTSSSGFGGIGGDGGDAGGTGGGPVINYRCGECNAQVPLSAADAVRCKECGHRVLYKERTRRMVQFEAR